MPLEPSECDRRAPQPPEKNLPHARIPDMERHDHRYVFGRLDSKIVLVVATPTERGWRCRSSAREYQHDYVHCETFEEIMNWIDVDMIRAFTLDRKEVLEHLSTFCQENPEWSFLTPPDDVEERVLQHLERGW